MGKIFNQSHPINVIHQVKDELSKKSNKMSEPKIKINKKVKLEENDTGMQSSKDQFDRYKDR